MQPVIVSAIRTAIGRDGGAFREVPAYQLGAAVIREAVKRTGIEPATINDVYFGNCFAEDGNLARVASLEAGLPVSVPAMTIDRQCGSGLTAITLASQAIRSESGQVFVAGGAENLTQRPFMLGRAKKAYDRMPPEFLRLRLAPESIGDPPMGITAENVAARYEISREDQDAYAHLSQERMTHAMANGYFSDQILPISAPSGRDQVTVTTDEHPRPGTTQEKLASLQPVFKPDGSVTAGNSSGINDGAAALVIMSGDLANSLGLPILGRIRATSITGVDPHIMGIGPVFAVKQLLDATHLTVDDIDLIELNEAFAAQVLACIRELHLDPERVNVNGGAIAHGHPIAATGAILTTKLLYEMRRRDAHRGIVTLCIGGGQGIATLIER